MVSSTGSMVPVVEDAGVLEAGVLVPCMCGGKAGIVCFEKRGALSGDMGYLASIKCRDCWMELRRGALKKKWAKDSALLAWNTRAPILSAEEMEMLEGMKSGD